MKKHQFVRRQLPQLFKLAVEVALVQYRVPLRLRGTRRSCNDSTEEHGTRSQARLLSDRSTHGNETLPLHSDSSRTAHRPIAQMSESSLPSSMAAAGGRPLKVTHQQQSGRKSCEGGQQHGLPAYAPPIAQDIPQACHAYSRAQAEGVRASSGRAQTLESGATLLLPLPYESKPPETPGARAASQLVMGAPATMRDNQLRHTPLRTWNNVEAVLACTLLCPGRLSRPAWPSISAKVTPYVVCDPSRGTTRSIKNVLMSEQLHSKWQALKGGLP